MKKNMFFLIFWSLVFNSICLSQGIIHLDISTSTDTVDFIITNKWGKRTGNDPRGTGIKYNEIPGAGYGAEGYGDNPWFNVFLLSMVSPQDDGVYEIKLIASELSKFTCTVDTRPESNGPLFKKELNTFLDKNSEMTYKFTYYGTPGVPAKVEKVIAITSLGQDITTGGKLNLVGNQTFVNSLQLLCSQMVTFFNAGNKVQAYNKLSSLKYQIQNAYTNPTGSQFVNDYAYTVLMEDITLTFVLINCTTCESTERIQK